TLQGDDILLDLPVTIQEAALGSSVRVPTPSGSVMMTIPKGSNSGTTLRLKGKGAARRGGGNGDQLVKLKVMLPSEPNAELNAFLSKWAPGPNDNPRRDM
ncbi:MAG: DnaJ C-terminal domain-containing protein, partial [Aestuariivirga sp.]